MNSGLGSHSLALTFVPLSSLCRVHSHHPLGFSLEHQEQFRVCRERVPACCAITWGCRCRFLQCTGSLLPDSCMEKTWPRLALLPLSFQFVPWPSSWGRYTWATAHHHRLCLPFSWSALALPTTMEMKTRPSSSVWSPRSCTTPRMAQPVSQVRKPR